MSRSARCVLALLAAVFYACGASAGANAPSRMVILGVDGMDPKLLAQYMEEGVVPNLSRLASTGGFMPLGTSIPPQSPVAWSTFITGMDPGSHGISISCTWIARTSRRTCRRRAFRARRQTLPMGRWRIPLKSPHELLRQGTAFWELLEDNGVHTRLFRIPANYPPVETSSQAISGMGTPDLQGTSGTFTLYTTDPNWKAGTVSGGIIERVALRDGAGSSRITGPPNALLKSSPNVTAGLQVLVDPQNPVALVRVGDGRLLLQQGEWSDWLPVRFDLMPHVSSVSGMVRFYLKQVRPHLMLYMTPVNIDPRAPAQAIAAPSKYAYELAEDAGPFYTEEMPEDARRCAPACSSARIPDADAAGPGRAQEAARFRAAALRERTAALTDVLLLQQHRSATSHDVPPKRIRPIRCVRPTSPPISPIRCATPIGRSTSRSAR